MLYPALIVAYVGPETILPLMSALAAVAGVFMMFWNSTRRALLWCVQKIKRSESE